LFVYRLSIAIRSPLGREQFSSRISC